MTKTFFLNNKNWHKHNIKGINLFYKGFNPHKIQIFIKKITTIKNLKETTKYLNYLGENFALIIEKNKEVIAATDKIRSFPLLYYKNNNKLFIFENYHSIKKIDVAKIINKKQLLLFSLSGYTLDEDTIYKNIYQINQGSAIHFFKGKIDKIKYYKPKNKVIKKVTRFSKYIILNFLDGSFCLIHLGMSGTIHIVEKNL